MRIKLQNFGMISNTDIEVNSITLTTDENDSGKRTVGKLLYCILKRFIQNKEDFYFKKNENSRSFYQNILKDKNIEYIHLISKEIHSAWIKTVAN